MHQIRTILVAMLAICLAVFPAGMSRASGPGPASEASHHVHAAGVGTHEHGPAHHAATAEVGGHSHRAMFDAADHDCSGHGTDGKHCGSTCCGFGCHAFQLVLEPVLATRHSHLIQRTMAHDDQIGGGSPFSIERPPRFA